MTDNEIIKALECCHTSGDCSLCHLFRECPTSFKLEQYALDLLKRQNAEIDRLNNNISSMAVTMRNSAKATRNEAIKEFAERLKNEIISETAYGCDSNQHTGYYDYQIKIGDIPEYIDNLVKETVGEE